MIVFENDDEYYNWLDKNTEGFILNTKKDFKKTKEFGIHLSNCKVHITDRSVTEKGGNYIGGKSGKIKVGSNDINEIILFCSQYEKFIDFTLVCSKCSLKKYDKSFFDVSNYLFDNYPSEIKMIKGLPEGALKKIEVNSYERNPKARRKCIDYYGYKCQCCNFDFEDKYGEIGRNFIHVHHIVPISQIKEEYIIDPINDLIPLCPNCHSMIHKQNPPFSVNELKLLLKN